MTSESDSPRFHHRSRQTQRCAPKVVASTISIKSGKHGRGRQGGRQGCFVKNRRDVHGGCFEKNIIPCDPRDLTVASRNALYAAVSVTQSPTTTLGALYTLHNYSRLCLCWEIIINKPRFLCCFWTFENVWGRLRRPQTPLARSKQLIAKKKVFGLRPKLINSNRSY